MHFAARSQFESPYLRHSKSSTPARFDLRSSAVMRPPLADLPIEPEASDLGSAASYGNPELVRRIAQRARVPEASVVVTLGTSMGNHVAMSALFDPGDEVLIEEPTYDPLPHTARLLGAVVRRFPRRAENGYAIDPDDVRKALTPQTRLIVLCNLHNPTSAFTERESLWAIGAAAERFGARVLVDEVYREAVWGAAPEHALSLGEQFVVSSSLTKAYGLAGLRCGWILAAPELAERMRHLQSLFHGNGVRLAERWSALAMTALPAIEKRARQMLAVNRAAAREILGSCAEIDLTIPEYGITLAPRLLAGEVDALCRLLERYEVAVQPGAYFEMPQHFRIGLGGDPEVTREAFSRLVAALGELRKGA